MIEFPATVGKHAYEKQDDLIKLLDVEIQKLENVKGATLANCLDTALCTLGIKNTSCITDVRTIELITTYSFYKNNPHEAFNPIPQIWFEAYNILTKTEPRLF